ncbi:hypothetical protein DIPPA_10811 [Diplonema papillatum]|nr:hypothetical protein DIPPA_10811 [Diplonema papillatum]
MASFVARGALGTGHDGDDVFDKAVSSPQLSLIVSVVALALVMLPSWCMIVFARNTDLDPGGKACDQEVGRWLIVHGAVGWGAQLLYCFRYTVHMLWQEFSIAARPMMYKAMCLALLFLVCWFVYGNVVVFESTEKLCGGYTTEGRRILIAHYVVVPLAAAAHLYLKRAR